MSLAYKTFHSLIRYLGLIVIAGLGIISTLGTGGDDGGGGVAPVTYTGLEAQAAITSDNAKPLAEVAFLGVAAGTSFSVAVDQQVVQDETRAASVITITRMLYDTISSLNASNTLSAMPTGWVETQPPIPGECGGTASGSLNVNESDRTFSGSLAFSNFCNFGITMNGTVAFDGTCDAATFDPVTQTCEMEEFTMRFTTFTTSGYGVSETMTGTVATMVTATGYENTVNLVLRIDNENITFKFEDYVTTVTEGSPPGYDSVVVTGNVYHPSYGFVVVSTPTPVQFYSEALDTQPLSGVALLTGAAGTVGPTTATITFIDSNSYQIAVDSDGDGGTDVTWSCSWEPDECVMV